MLSGAVKKRTNKRFAMSAEGSLGESVKISFFEVDQSGTRRMSNTTALVVLLQKRKSKGFPGYEASLVSHGGEELSWLRAESSIGGLRVTATRDTTEHDMAAARDKALLTMLLCRFFDKRASFRVEDAVGGLTFRLAQGNGEGVKNVSEVWFNCSAGYRSEAELFALGTSRLLQQSLAESGHITLS